MLTSLERFTKLFDLSGKVAIVTGAAQGNGLGIAKALSDAGAMVVAADLEFKELPPDGTKLDQVIMDVTDEEAVKSAAKKIFERYGSIDILVNNAGIIYKNEVDCLELEQFKKVMDVNLNGTVICTKTVVPYMKQGKWGRIVNISSSQAYLSSETYSAYSASKAAISHLTRIWGKELAPYGIIINALCPSYVMTPMMQNSLEKKRVELNTDRQGAIDWYVKNIPLKRILEIDEVGNWAVMLCSDFSLSTTGNNFSITGGQVLL